MTVTGISWLTVWEALSVTVADPEALALLASVTVNDSVFVPLVLSVRVNVPVPV